MNSKRTSERRLVKSNELAYNRMNSRIIEEHKTFPNYDCELALLGLEVFDDNDEKLVHAVVVAQNEATWDIVKIAVQHNRPLRQRKPRVLTHDDQKKLFMKLEDKSFKSYEELAEAVKEAFKGAKKSIEEAMNETESI